MTLSGYYAKPLDVPKVFFVNEHREVEVDSGRVISDVADDLGIAVKRTAGIGFFPDYTIWVRGDDGSTSPMTWFERVIKRCKGWRRMADETLVLGDIEVWTQQGIGYRLAQSRPVSKPARTSEDGSARFDHENNAASTAWNHYGHPKAVGTGTREPPKYVPKKKKGAAADKAAAKAAIEAEEATKAAEVAEAAAAAIAIPEEDDDASFARRGSKLLVRAALAEFKDHSEDSDDMDHQPDTIERSIVPFTRSMPGRLMFASAATFLLTIAVWLVNTGSTAVGAYAFGVGMPLGIAFAFISVGLAMTSHTKECLFAICVLPPALWGLMYLGGELEMAKAGNWGYGIAALGFLALGLALSPTLTEA